MRQLIWNDISGENYGFGLSIGQQALFFQIQLPLNHAEHLIIVFQFCQTSEHSASSSQMILGMFLLPCTILWSLTRYTRNTNLWDRVCFQCKQTTPVFEYEHRDDQKRSLFHYLREECAQKKLAEWLHSAARSDAAGSQTDFDIANIPLRAERDVGRRYVLVVDSLLSFLPLPSVLSDKGGY